jgi:hypothetical protein
MYTKATLQYNTLLQFVFFIICMLLLSSCANSSGQLTLVAQNDAANTQISNVRNTATVVRARIQTTLDYAGTRAVEIEQQGLFIRSTLVALGTESAYINNNLPLPGNFPTFTPQPTSPARALITPAQQPQVTEELNAEGTLVQVTLEATQDSTQQARLENIVMASGVNDNDCALNINPRFTTSSTEIYVVATAFNIPAGATVTSIWQSNGTEVAAFSFEPENNINGDCIWFFIDQNDVTFVTGTWSVELRIDDVSASPPLPFQIFEN